MLLQCKKSSVTLSSLKNTILLGTAMVILISKNGKKVTCKALLDSGSQVNIVTQRIVRRLGALTNGAHLIIHCIGDTNKEAKGGLHLKLTSPRSKFEADLEAFVLKSIVPQQPHTSIHISSWDIPKDLKLSDPSFNVPSSIDVLLGAEFYHQILRPEQYGLQSNLPKHPI